MPPTLTMFLAGLAGAFVFSFLRPDRTTLWKPFTNVSGGALVSFWTAPALCEWRGWEHQSQQHAAAFLVGLLGMIACRLIVNSTENETAQQLVSGFLQRIFGKPPEKP